MSRLARVLQTHGAHRLHAAIGPLAEQIFAAWRRWQGPDGLPERIVHGDLKVSNIRFAGTRAVALVDLDTLADGTLDVELGDALRSWCNPHGEGEDAAFSLPLFVAAMQGYRRGSETAPPAAAEWESIVPGLERICLELSARFAWDALAESYFGWDARRYPTRGDHNLARARGQLALARSVAACRDEAQAALSQLRAG